MVNKIFLGIDPGATGALAVIDNTNVSVYDYDNANGILALKDLADSAKLFNAKIIACIEKVNAMPGQGVSSMFKFGKNYGEWLGALVVLKIPYDFVTPQKWQKEIYDSMMTKGVDKKELSLNRARRLFPELSHMLRRKKDNGRADALLIAEYCRRINNGA